MKRSDISRYNRAVFFHSPWLKAINLSIAVLLGIGLVAAYWIVWRPLPQTSGTIEAPVSGEASVVRDDLGVPHITAESIEDALFLQGYVTAQDRLWQMDLMRRLADGQLAEVLGAAAQSSDLDARRLRLSRLADAQVRGLTPTARSAFAAYARGVNYFIETHRDRLPVEFTVLRYAPRPWSMRDTVLIGLQMYRALTTTWQEELRKQHMLERGEPDLVSRLFPPSMGGDPAPGSNAWAVSGAHTASGSAILASDPHLQFALPSPWYMVHLTAPELNVTGATLPGVPAVIIGHNEQIAWGMTNLEFDMQDLYVEQINLANGTYLYRGSAAQARREPEVVLVKDGGREEMVNFVTGHGPLFLNDAGRSYSMRWSGAEADGADFPFLAMNQARDWEQFSAALERYSGPAQNVVYADGAGNIGYHVAGYVPMRQPGCGGDVPSDGASDPCDWQGRIPYEDLPQSFNPESGIIATANNNPFPEDYPYPVAGVFAPHYRVNQIRALLASRDDWDVEGMLAVQKDVYSAFSRFLARQTVEAWDRSGEGTAGPDEGDSAVAEAVEQLRGWNGQMEIGLAAPLIARVMFEQLRSALAERAAPGSGNEYGAPIAPEVIERMLIERPPEWFDDWDRALLEVLATTVEGVAEVQGSNVARWDYGQYGELVIAHPVLGRIRGVGRYFRIGPAPRSGSLFTVKQMTNTLGPSFRMVVDFADLDGALANIGTGQSGQPLSPHFTDQWEAHYYGTSFPMQFQQVNADDTLTVLPLP